MGSCVFFFFFLNRPRQEVKVNIPVWALFVVRMWREPSTYSNFVPFYFLSIFRYKHWDWCWLCDGNGASKLHILLIFLKISLFNSSFQHIVCTMGLKWYPHPEVLHCIKGCEVRHLDTCPYPLKWLSILCLPSLIGDTLALTSICRGPIRFMKMKM